MKVEVMRGDCDRLEIPTGSVWIENSLESPNATGEKIECGSLRRCRWGMW
jgi:hypothetical protein